MVSTPPFFPWEPVAAQQVDMQSMYNALGYPGFGGDSTSSTTFPKTVKKTIHNHDFHDLLDEFEKIRRKF